MKINFNFYDLTGDVVCFKTFFNELIADVTLIINNNYFWKLKNDLDKMQDSKRLYVLICIYSFVLQVTVVQYTGLLCTC